MMKWTTIAFFALAMQAMAADEKKPQPKEAKVSVELSFSVDEYDPSQPSKAVMKCMVRNDAHEGIHVPVGYDARSPYAASFIQLQGGGLTLCRPKKSKEDVKLEWVEPRKEQVIFELPLDDILLGANRFGLKNTYSWSWRRRGSPPPSPIHKRGQQGFVAEVSFSVKLDIAGQDLTSNATLKIKTTTPKPKKAEVSSVKPKQKEAKVSLQLSFSVEEYDPWQPSKATVKCVVRNDWLTGIHVPVGYEGRSSLYYMEGSGKPNGYVRLQSDRGLTLLRKGLRKDDLRLAWVEPGNEQVVFELPLEGL